MRVRYSMINAIVSVVAQVITIIITFISRRVFLMVLGESVLGVNSLFNQIISMMSLMELGIGSAIIYSLYQPLAVDDKEQIAAIMRLYKKIYTVIGCTVLLAGSALTPFITFFITGDISEISNIYLIFMLFVINSALTYFNSYKQNLIVADQKKYITIIFHNGLFILLNIVQIVVLLRTRNYELFLILQIVVTLAENLLLSQITKKMYPFLATYKAAKVKENTLNKMKKNVKALLLHRVGGVFASSTDTIIISKFIGIIIAGKYMNYLYVTNAFNTLTTNFFSSFTSSVGNFSVTAEKKDSYELFRKLIYLNFIVFGFITICTWCLISDFINIFFGSNMVLSDKIVVLLVLKFYLNGMRSTLLTYKDALGIYHQDRFRPVFEGAINLIAALILVKDMGLAGVVIASILSNVCVNTWIEPYAVYKEGFEKKWTDYLIHYAKYFGCLVIIGAIMTMVANNFVVGNFIHFILKAFAIAGTSLILLLVFGYMLDREELKYYVTLVKKVILKRK